IIQIAPIPVVQQQITSQSPIHQSGSPALHTSFPAMATAVMATSTHPQKMLLPSSTRITYIPSTVGVQSSIPLVTSGSSVHNTATTGYRQPSMALGFPAIGPDGRTVLQPLLAGQTPLLTAGHVGTPQRSSSQLPAAAAGQVITAIYPPSAGVAATTHNLVYTASPSLSSATTTPVPPAILPKAPSAPVSQATSVTSAMAVTPGLQHGAGIMAPGALAQASAQGALSTPYHGGLVTAVQGNLPFSLRPARPLQKQQQPAKTKAPVPNIPSGPYDTPPSSWGGGKPQVPGGAAPERGEGRPETPHKPAAEELPPRDPGPQRPPEDRTTQDAWQHQAAGPLAPAPEEGAESCEAGPPHTSPPKPGVPPAEDKVSHHACAQAGPSGEDRTAWDSAPGVTPRGAGSPDGYTSKSTNTEITFKKEPGGKYAACTEWRGPLLDNRPEAPSTSQPTASTCDPTKPSASSSDTADKKDPPKKVKVRPPPLKKTFDSVDKVLSEVDFEERFAELPEFRPEEVLPSPTLQALTTSPRAILSSYRKKRKNSTG
uniref:protein capicua homolog n=1 Tax=Pristiophorus japonicus TaxID=55135 RepID=UPI00398EE4CB